MTRAQALADLIGRIEASSDRYDVPAAIINAARLNARLVWRALEGSLDAAARLEGIDPRPEAKDRLLRALRALLAAETPTP